MSSPWSVSRKSSQEKIQFRHPGFRSHLEAVLPGWRAGSDAEFRFGVNLFDERFIVFEIDKIKDDPYFSLLWC